MVWKEDRADDGRRGVRRSRTISSFRNGVEFCLLAHSFYVNDPERKEVPLKPSDRRLAQRFNLPITLFIREWKAMTPTENGGRIR